MSGEELRAHDFIASAGLFADPPMCPCGASIDDPIHDVPIEAALAAPSTPEPSGLREARAFVDAYMTDTLTHPASGVQMTGYTVLRDGDTHSRFVHSESDEARLVGFLRAALAATSTPEPSGGAEQALIRAANAPSSTEPNRLAVPHYRDTEAIWKAIEPYFRAAPSTEPALDVEGLASIEHEQWMTWARSVTSADDVTIGPERLARWQSYMVPYSDLPEHVKEHDRVWARAVLARLAESQP